MRARKEALKELVRKYDGPRWTKAALQAHAEMIGLKTNGVGWNTCCPPYADKANIASAIISFEVKPPDLEDSTHKQDYS